MGIGARNYLWPIQFVCPRELISASKWGFVPDLDLFASFSKIATIKIQKEPPPGKILLYLRKTCETK
jgi:hypothetical protein